MRDKNQLYAFNQDYGWGELSFLFTATNKQLERIWEKEVYWHDELGKHSEGTYCFGSGTVEFVDVSEEIGRELTTHRLIPYWDIEDIIARVEEKSVEVLQGLVEGLVQQPEPSSKLGKKASQKKPQEVLGE